MGVFSRGLPTSSVWGGFWSESGPWDHVLAVWADAAARSSLTHSAEVVGAVGWFEAAPHHALWAVSSPSSVGAGAGLSGPSAYVSGLVGVVAGLGVVSAWSGIGVGVLRWLRPGVTFILGWGLVSPLLGD